MSERQIDMVLAGGRIPLRAAEAEASPREEIRPMQPEG
jgi:hypothetical protein